MKLFIEDDNGIKTELSELKEINQLDGDTIIITTSKQFTRETCEALNERLKEIGKKCIILYGINNVYCIK